ncbi:MAG TPA: CocE/NonD family hydrolase [Thermohalobaculum sp.]|nr:CocE/NonD family hydrolase [Thermohalobaculum sp.]
MGFTVEETVWIALSDGTRLAARIWMPQGQGPFPAVLEFLPYRRRDGTSERDESTYPAFAEAGIAGVRVDSRGNGDSDGLFDDEYSPQELSDACEVIAWIAAQGWSSGSVGMMGISWGGFNALQVAAMRPPALKAVISLSSTADRYNDDIHYKGGCLMSANVYWAGVMLSYASRPPDPGVLGNSWREVWMERLRAEPFLLETWLRHQRRDAYWKHGSICEDWSAIQVPVFIIAGWADGYRNAPATVAANAKTMVKAMTGPWVHKYPHFAWPRPRADFTGMAIAWWRKWLAGEDTGVEDWPAYRAYLSEGPRPGGWRADEPGRWVGLAGWPSGAVEESRLTLGADGLLGGASFGDRVVTSPQNCGTQAGEYFTLKPDGELPGDQNLDDALSAVWQTEPLDEALDILGRPGLRLRVAIDQPQGNLIARLVDVHPDGAANLIARGMLNLCHRNGNAEPEAVVPGDFVDVTLKLDETGYRLAPGHRLRLAISTAYWPLILPSPATVTATIRAGGSSALTLPLLREAPEAAPPLPDDPDPLPKYPVLEAGHSRRHVERDLQTGRVRYVISEDGGWSENPTHGMRKRETRDETWEIDPADPEGATGHLVFGAERARDGWAAGTRAEIRFSCQSERYQVEATLTAQEDGQEVFARSWSFIVPRDHM